VDLPVAMDNELWLWTLWAFCKGLDEQNGSSTAERLELHLWPTNRSR
jgi:hypothetical protein